MTDILEHGTVVSARRRVAQVNLDDYSFRILGPSVRAIAALADEIDSLRAEVRELRSPDGTASTPSLDESNQHVVEMRMLLSSAAELITLATDLKPISEWQRDVVRRAEAWLKDYYRTTNHA